MTRTRLTALAAAAAIAAGTLAPLAPAHAGGSVSISIAPGSADAEHAMRAGLGLFAIANGIKNGSITQNGIGNAAGLIQNGSGNLGIVHQEGNGHEGTLRSLNLLHTFELILNCRTVTAILLMAPGDH